MTVIHDIQQGTPTWQAFRAQHFGASEAAAMLGLSKNMNRSELLRAKRTGIAPEHSDWVRENVLDHGHDVEAMVRPIIEADLDEPLYPVTCSKPGTKLSASCDGLTLAGDTAWENKQWNAKLAPIVEAGSVPDEHMPQCQQILLVTAAQRLIFTMSDGTPERTLRVEVKPDPEWFHRIERGWAQFAADLEAFEPHAPAPVVVAAPLEALPAPSVSVQGSIAVVTNLDRFGAMLRAFIERIPTKPSTDQEFADTDAACKALKTAEERLQAAEDTALGSMANVEAMRTTVATLRNLARDTRLASEKLVAARKQQIREDEVRRGRDAFAAHFRALCDRLGGPLLPPMTPDFGAAIKSLRTLDSVRNAIDTTLANAKIAANELADKVQANLKTIDAATPTVQLARLFHDRNTLVLKDADAVKAIVANRVAEFQAEEQRRLDAERERIRAEEQQRVAREEQQRLEREAQEARDRIRNEQAQQQRQGYTAAPDSQQVLKAEPARADATDREPPAISSPSAGSMGAGQAAGAASAGDLLAPAIVDARPPIKLSDIKDRIAPILITEEGLRTLGINSIGKQGAATMYAASAFPLICDALVRHLMAAKAAA